MLAIPNVANSFIKRDILFEGKLKVFEENISKNGENFSLEQWFLSDCEDNSFES